MKLLRMFLAPIVAMGIASTASARDYHDLVAEGYRWVKSDGPYARNASLARASQQEPLLRSIEQVLARC